MVDRRKRVPKSGSKPTRTLIVLRRGGTGATLSFYAGIEGHDVLLYGDKLETGPATGLVVDEATLAELGVYAHPHHAARCRDYALYAARQAFPEYGHYWLIGADVRIHTAEARDFFLPLAAVTSDLLATRLGPRPAGWGWGSKMRRAGPVHGCALPIARLSADAIDLLLEARRAASADPTLATPADWPNDEAFVPTTAADLELEAEDLNAGGRRLYAEESFGGTHTFDTAWLQSREPDGLLYHPVRNFEDWTQQAEAMCHAAPPRLRNLENPAGLKSAEAASIMDRLGHSCLRTPTFAGSGFVPLMLAESLWRTQPWARAPEAAAEAEGGRQKACHLTLERRFGRSEKARQIGTAHLALCTLNRNNLRSVKPGDFECGPGLPIAHLPRQMALPYAYDFATRELLFTLHTHLGAVLERPFLYDGQRALTRVLARVNLADLPRIYGPIDPVAAPVLVFSVGRTGSTLLQKLIGCVTPRSISEPDTLTQMAEAGPAFAALSYDEKRAAVYYALAPLSHIRLPGGADGRCVVKLRSQANGMSQEIARAFPAAKYVFMLREKRAWARSTFRAFGMSPVAAANRLLQALRALRHLQHNRVDLTLISYEDVLADPAGTTARITGADVAADPALAARIACVLNADSQAGHGLSRERSAQAKPGEEDWLAEFEARWAEIRPEAVLKQLKLDY